MSTALAGASLPHPAGPRRFLRHLDVPLLGAAVALMGFGLVMVYSSTHVSSLPFLFVRSQGLHLAVGVAVALVLLAVDYRVFASGARVLYVLNLLLLAAVLVAGRTSLGAQRWIPLGPLGQFQPSEMAKIVIVITLAKHMTDRPGPYRSVWSLLPFLGHVALPMVLIFKQPDLGTALVYAAIFVGMLYAAGARRRDLAALGGAVLVVAPIFWHILKEYQRRRLLAFVHPSLDPLGSGYGIIQSKIAVGSGLVWGKGLFEGTQGVLRFVPEHHTDFIFSVIGEELGFVGAMLLLGLFLLFIWRGLHIAAVARDRFGGLVAVGIVSMVAFHVFVNVGMTVGIMPITGIPLPFISYGGSALMAMVWATAILLNVGMRHQKTGIGFDASPASPVRVIRLLGRPERQEE
ncbi:MAG TPA: rod shape-determining protein RodA [bacterium]|nr:rod shape-determining protein RodA [bacterium]